MIKKLRWFLLFGLFQILVSGVYAAVPSWQNYVVYVEGVETQGEADAITEAISGSDPKMIKSVDGLTPKSGQVFIHHDHHNTRLNSLVQAAKQ